MNTKDHLGITPSVALLSTTGGGSCGSGHCFYVSPSLLFGEGNGNPLQYSCLGNPMDREASQVTVTKSQTRLNVSTRCTLIQTCTLLLRKALFMRKAFFMKTSSEETLFCQKWKDQKHHQWINKYVQSGTTKTIFQIISSFLASLFGGARGWGLTQERGNMCALPVGQQSLGRGEAKPRERGHHTH